ncbi:hypothetical protein BAMA_04055 [Bacillus manliponensis]|uniref:Uncharacterized protein n=1 Tax=Bacillus manliponensis TaxID=574376 RepID=A0A073JWU0_9BACI|nr:hypothetical protein [Bacillus manliponensis]KEK18687.1 hypothetical protein BAMA_04055 [Bacillus manliponensis]
MKHYLKSNMGKVARDMFFVQLIWSSWYLLFLLTANIIIGILITRRGVIEGDFLEGGFIDFSHHSSRVFMLVIGIISAYAFIRFYVKQGVTRKDYFFGAALGSIGLSLVIPVLCTILSGIQHIIINIFQFSPVIDNTPFLGSYTNWFSIIIVYTLNIFTYYIIGWLIGAGYHRYGWIIGFGFIALGIACASLLEFLWTFDTSFLDIRGPARILSLPADVIVNMLPNINHLPMYVSLLGNILLLGVGLWIIRIVTKRATIKVK